MKVADMSFVRLRPDHPLAARLQDVILWDVPLAQWYIAIACSPQHTLPSLTASTWLGRDAGLR